MVQHFKHNEIDKKKWDACIDASPNCLVYALSWYLDIVCPGWEAFVEGEYDTVMPLPVRKKWGLNYMFQPDYTQQLGIFSASNISNEIIHQFLDKIPQHYKLVQINFNSSNTPHLLDISYKPCNNYELVLSKKYIDLYSNYSSSTKDSLKRAYKKEQLIIDPEINISDISSFFNVNVPVKITRKQLDIYTAINKYAFERGMFEKYGLYNNKKELVAVGSFIHLKKRILFFSSVSSEEGKKNRAMFQLIDFIIKKHAGSGLILDFEGSNIESIARFFSGFGSENKIYASYMQNNFSFFMKCIFKVYEVTFGKK